MAKKFYAVMGAFSWASLQVGGVSLENQEDVNGVSALMPLFTNKKKALHFAGKKYKVMAMEVGE